MRDNGGPAFPQGKGTGYFGMSLRDWFAGQALAGMFAHPTMAPSARAAYDAADAMLEARK